MRLALVLHNIRSAYNVGAILRTAEGLGVEKVIMSGYTPRINDVRVLPHLREKLNREIHKTALNAELMVEQTACDDLREKIKTWKNEGWLVVGLENNLENIKQEILQINQPELKNRLGDKVVLILGEEVSGIEDWLRREMDLFVEIPMKGQKESLNVSVAAGIALAYLII